MALIGCIRGGRSRSLIALSHTLKRRFPDAAIIFVSFNDVSCLDASEHVDLVAALCRRILFQARRAAPSDCENENDKLFSSQYQHAHVNREDMLTWLGDHPCVLLIDDLGMIPIVEKGRDSVFEEFASFLKYHFLMRRNRYFVFSSHVQSTARKVVNHIDLSGNRDVVRHEMPLISSVAYAAVKFDWPQLTPQIAMWCGLIPSLIHLTHNESKEDGDGVCREGLPDEKCYAAIEACMDSLTSVHVRLLLSSFINGNSVWVLPPLLPLMSVTWNNNLRWIPHFMVKVLTCFSRVLQEKEEITDRRLGVVLKEIVELFHEFRRPDQHSDDAWKNLFVIVLLLRTILHEFEEVVLPLRYGFHQCSVSINELLRESESGVISTVDELVANMIFPSSFPHIAIYFPKNKARLDEVDVVVAAYYNDQSRYLFGYQLNSRREVSQRIRDMFQLLFVIGDESLENRISTRASQRVIAPGIRDIDVFFGVSGQHWTPKYWKQLTSRPPALQKKVINMYCQRKYCLKASLLC